MIVAVQATELQGAERDEKFSQQAALYPGFAGYQSRTSRIIPVVALIPVSSMSRPAPR